MMGPHWKHCLTGTITQHISARRNLIMCKVQFPKMG
uniref:Uncharacterized protein n=1 Tax=Lotus japonicus TaxID=34305 RepID=I3T282_LOTJA|nr:unknown [Lotus japonicus]